MISPWAYLATRAVILGGAFFSGCVQVGPKQVGTVPVQHSVAEREHCSIPPIPAVVHISIEPGKPVQSDAGGEALLRAYAAIRERKL